MSALPVESKPTVTNWAPGEFDRLLASESARHPPTEPWGEPDLSVLRLCRRPPPPLPLDVFGPAWAAWISEAAEAAATAPDYVTASVLAGASALLGHARWPQAVPGWSEPPHLWIATIGDSGTNKSAGMAAIMRDVLPELERRMGAGFPEHHAQWRTEAEAHKIRLERWEKDARAAGSNPLPEHPGDEPPEPRPPVLTTSDVTVEKVGALLAEAAPKGLLVVRDELSGWLLGMTTYNDAGRQFWLEAHGGHPYRVDRQKLVVPLVVPRLAVSVFGSTQPAKISEMFHAADDGLLARFAWFWPDSPPFRLGRIVTCSRIFGPAQS